MAIGSMTTNSTVDMIDKTLKTENVPADAAAVGDIVLDPDGNAIFYSKAEVEAKIKEILAAQREEDLARIKFWASDDPTSPASFIGGTWERMEDCTIWGASDTHPAGTRVEAGLPNITGQITTAYVDWDPTPAILDPKGAFSYSDNKSEKYGFPSVGKSGVAEKKLFILNFSASNSNSVYGASNTVQPPAYGMYLWRRVA